MEEQRRPDVLDALNLIEAEEEAIRRLIEEEKIPVARRETEKEIVLFDGKSKVKVKVPTATVIANYHDRAFARWSKGEGTTDAEVYLLSQCLLSYELYDENGELIVNSSQVPKNRFLETFLETVHPLVFRWLVRELVLLSGADFVKVLRKFDEILREKGLVTPEPEGGSEGNPPST